MYNQLLGVLFQNQRPWAERIADFIERRPAAKQVRNRRPADRPMNHDIGTNNPDPSGLGLCTLPQYEASPRLPPRGPLVERFQAVDDLRVRFSQRCRDRPVAPFQHWKGRTQFRRKSNWHAWNTRSFALPVGMFVKLRLPRLPPYSSDQGLFPRAKGLPHK